MTIRSITSILKMYYNLLVENHTLSFSLILSEASYYQHLLIRLLRIHLPSEALLFSLNLCCMSTINFRPKIKDKTLQIVLHYGTVLFKCMLLFYFNLPQFYPCPRGTQPLIIFGILIVLWLSKFNRTISCLRSDECEYFRYGSTSNW